jgi:signal transduction histidine kinase
MFRVRDWDSPPVGVITGRIIIVTVLIALGVSIASLALVVRELQLLGHLRDGIDDSALQALRREMTLQVYSGVVIAGALAACAAAVIWLRRRYMTAHQTLRQVKMLAHNILASMDQGVITTDREGFITSINSAASGLLGVDFECVGRPLDEISTQQIPLDKLNTELVERRTPIRDRDYVVTRDRWDCRYRVDAHFLRDMDNTALGSVLLLRDVTKRVLLEERMTRMERFISLGTLASGLHHEIKNPLTALSLHLQLLEEQLHDVPAVATVDELLGVLKTEMHRLNGVLESFRNFANLQKLTVQPTDILEVLDNVIRLIRPQATEQGVHLALLHPEIDLPKLVVDEQKIEQALLNLLINALEAMPQGGTLSASAATKNGSVTIEITDTGPGISPEYRENVFKPYFSTKGQGTGMGLPLTEKLVSQHGGQIEYETGPQGTSFRIHLPLEPAAENL